MLIITIEVNSRHDHIIGIKEDLAMHLERYGDTRVVSVEEAPQKQMEQMTIGGLYREEKRVLGMRR